MPYDDAVLRKAAATMLRDASGRWGNDVCEDFDLAEIMPEGEIEAFIRAYHAWNGDPDDLERSGDLVIGRLSLPISAVVQFVADQLQGIERYQGRRR